MLAANIGITALPGAAFATGTEGADPTQWIESPAPGEARDAHAEGTERSADADGPVSADGAEGADGADAPDAGAIPTEPVDPDAALPELATAQPSLGRAVGSAFSCQTDVLYGVNYLGQVFEFNATSGGAARIIAEYPGDTGITATQAWTFNSVGVTPRGTELRLMTELVQATILGVRMNVSAGSLAPTSSAPSFPFGWQAHDSKVAFVAGAVNPANGEYIAGTVERTSKTGSARSTFYRVGANGALTSIGYVQHTFPQQAAEVTMNGDMTFDSNGDMYYMSSVEGKATLWKVAGGLMAGSGTGALAATRVAEFAIPVDYFNGFHIASNGIAYASSLTSVYQYDMTDWSLTKTFTSVLPAGTSDIGGCANPSWVSLEKNVVGKRVDPTDQFVLSLERQGGATASATTTGAAAGLQPGTAGPIEAVSGDTFRISETMAPGSRSTLAKYDSTWECTDIEGTPIASGEGSEGTFTVPALSLGANMLCTFSNAPSTGSLTLVKDFDISYGAPALPEEWTLTATAVDATAVAPEQAAFDLHSGETVALPAGVPYRLSESGPVGYELQSLSCLVNGSTTPVVLAAPYEVQLGSKETMVCTYVNADLPGSLSWSKVDPGGELIADSEWTIRFENETLPFSIWVQDRTPDFEYAEGDEDPAAGKFLVSGLPWGTHTLSEFTAPPGYILDPTPRSFTISGDHLAGAFADGESQFINTPEEPPYVLPPMPALPFTGTPEQLTALAILLGGVALVALVARRLTKFSSSTR